MSNRKDYIKADDKMAGTLNTAATVAATAANAAPAERHNKFVPAGEKYDLLDKLFKEERVNARAVDRPRIKAWLDEVKTEVFPFLMPLIQREMPTFRDIASKSRFPVISEMFPGNKDHNWLIGRLIVEAEDAYAASLVQEVEDSYSKEGFVPSGPDDRSGCIGTAALEYFRTNSFDASQAKQVDGMPLVFRCSRAEGILYFSRVSMVALFEAKFPGRGASIYRDYVLNVLAEFPEWQAVVIERERAAASKS